MFDRYTPHPLHQFIPFVMILIAAVIAGAFPGWITIAVFIATIVGGLATMLWIAVAGKIREESEYWTNIGYDINLLRRSHPDIWHALHLKNPPYEVHIPQDHVVLEEEVTGEEGRSPIYEQVNHTFELSPAEMQFLANELLSGKRTLAETEWKFTIIGSTRIRSLKDKFKKANLIAPVHPSAPTQGLMLTEKGVRYFKKYASDWAIELYEKRQVQTMKSQEHNPPHPPPHSASP